MGKGKVLVVGSNATRIEIQGGGTGLVVADDISAGRLRVLMPNVHLCAFP